MSKLKRAKTVVLGSKDQERLQLECNVSIDSYEPRESRDTEDLKARDSSLQAAKEFNSILGYEVEKLQEERGKLLQRISELEETVSQLNNTVAKNMHELRIAKDENDVLRVSLEESLQEAQVLRVDLETKTQNLKLMEDHTNNVIIRSDLLVRSKTDTDTQLQKNREDISRLKLEVDNSRRISTMEREESQHLANDLVSAEKQIKLLTKQLKEAKDTVEDLQKDNVRLADEIDLAQGTLKDKIIELNATKQEVEFHRHQKFNTSRNSNVFEIQGIERVSRGNSDDERFSSERIGDLSALRSDFAFQSRRSDFQQNMFQMLQSLRGASNIFSSHVALDEKEPEICEEDLQDNFFSRGTHRESTKWDGEAMHSVDEHVERSMSDEKEPAKMNILDIYAHLTAAAVKTNYPNIDIPKAYLVQVGMNMPFWELHPYYTHIFESAREKNKTKRSRTTRRTGTWFKWMRKREHANAPEIVEKNSIKL